MERINKPHYCQIPGCLNKNIQCEVQFCSLHMTATDLLAAVKRAQSALELADTTGKFFVEVQKLQAVIAKAEGRDQDEQSQTS